MSDLERAVESIVHDCMGVKKGESVLVVCNAATHRMGEMFRAQAEEAGADAVLTSMPERASHAEEPPRTVAQAMLAADVVLAPTIQSLSHTEARKQASDRGVRIATLPGVTEEMLARVMSAGLHTLVNRTLQVAEALTVGSSVHIETELGTDLSFSIEGRDAIADAGGLTGPGAFGNIPCGEGYVSPLERTAEGTLVVDGSIATFGLMDVPVRMVVKEGHLVEAEGGCGPQLIDTLTGHGKFGTNLAEFGIGTNDRATMTGNVLEDEKIMGTIHIAFGASAGIGGTVQVPIHLDCVVKGPTVEIDGHRLIDRGKLQV